MQNFLAGFIREADVIEIHFPLDRADRDGPVRILIFGPLLSTSCVRSSTANASVNCVPMFTTCMTGAMRNARNTMKVINWPSVSVCREDLPRSYVPYERAHDAHQTPWPKDSSRSSR